MTRLRELKDVYHAEAELTERIFRKAMLRIDHLADGDEAKRQQLLIEMLDWFNSELDGDVFIITYKD